MKKFAFTMAEILISLTIIGIIAAITLPALQANINERAWKTQKKALYARMSQAIAMMPTLGGIYDYTSDGKPDYATSTYKFISELGKVYRITNVCNYDDALDCGINIKNNDFHHTTMDGKENGMNIPMLKNYTDKMGADCGGNCEGLEARTYAIETTNGESMLVLYNPLCSSNGNNLFQTDGTSPAENYTYSKVCATFIYDLNGKSSPNTVGKDIGVITALYSTDSIVAAPRPVSNVSPQFTDYKDLSSYCSDGESKLPSLEDAIAMAYNNRLFLGGDANPLGKGGFSTADAHISSDLEFKDEEGNIYTKTFGNNWYFEGAKTYHLQSQGDVKSHAWCVEK